MNHGQAPLLFRIYTAASGIIVIDAIEHSDSSGEVSAGFMAMNSPEDIFSLRAAIDKFIQDNNLKQQAE